MITALNPNLRFKSMRETCNSKKGLYKSLIIAMTILNVVLSLQIFLQFFWKYGTLLLLENALSVANFFYINPLYKFYYLMNISHNFRTFCHISPRFFPMATRLKCLKVIKDCDLRWKRKNSKNHEENYETTFLYDQKEKQKYFWRRRRFDLAKPKGLRIRLEWQIMSQWP